jgi:peptidylprolyl isomerase
MPWLLLSGAAIGLALAASGMLEPRGGGNALSAEVAAVVGERVIRRVDYERMLAGVEKDLRSPIDDATRRRVLERMIDEELLVQQALDLDLAAADRRVRGELVSGLVESVVTEVDRDEPSTAEIERHYRENVDFFTRPGRVHVQTIFFSRTRKESEVRATEAREALEAGAALPEIEAQLGDPQIAAVPDGLLPQAKLRDYLGPAVVENLAELETGAWSAPVETAEGYRLIRVVAREGKEVPTFEEVEALVRRDLIRRRGDEALRRYLDGLRDQTQIERNASLFVPPTPVAPVAPSGT